jgi:hypothetical protein
VGDVPLLELGQEPAENSDSSPEFVSALVLSVTELVKGGVDGNSMSSSAVTTVAVTPQQEVQRIFIYTGSPVDLGGSVMLSGRRLQSPWMRRQKTFAWRWTVCPQSTRFLWL